MRRKTIASIWRFATAGSELNIEDAVSLMRWALPATPSVTGLALDVTRAPYGVVHAPRTLALSEGEPASGSLTSLAGLQIWPFGHCELN